MEAKSAKLRAQLMHRLKWRAQSMSKNETSPERQRRQEKKIAISLKKVVARPHVVKPVKVSSVKEKIL